MKRQSLWISSPGSTPAASPRFWSSTTWRRSCACAAACSCSIRAGLSPTRLRTKSWRTLPCAKPISARGESMLRLENMSCGYGAIRAVRDLSIDVPTGSVFALLGPNGAGKTSTIMAIMGHVDIHGGRIILETEDITRRRAIARVGLGISLVPEGRQLFSDLTVDENLTVGGYARPADRDAAKRDRVFGYFPRLHERRTQLAGSLSGGEQQMLAIGRALMAEPRLLLVDELSLGLMPKMVDLCL